MAKMDAFENYQRQLFRNKLYVLQVTLQQYRETGERVIHFHITDTGGTGTGR